MGHDFNTKERAFQLWLEDLSFDEIARRMDEEKRHVNRKTLVRWSQKPDKKTGKTWKDRKAEVQGKLQEKNDDRAVDRMTRLLARAEKIQEDVAEALRAIPKVRSVGEGVNAFVQITNMIQKYAPTRTVEGDAGVVIDKLLNVLLKHPKVGIVIEKYRTELLDDMARALKSSKAEG